MAEEKKGQSIEKWDEVKGCQTSNESVVSERMDENSGTTQGERFIALRESAGMNRKEFAEYLGVPYRTMTDWERDMRLMPDYVFALIEYKVSHDLGEQMRNTEDMLEQNDSCIDGIINNLPEPEEQHDKKSVIKKLKDCAKSVEEESERLPKMHCPVLERE